VHAPFGMTHGICIGPALSTDSQRPGPGSSGVRKWSVVGALLSLVTRHVRHVGQGTGSGMLNIFDIVEKFK
jgi:hypothetical protein